MFLPRTSGQHLLTLIVVVLALGGCSAEKDKTVAIAATDEFHKRFNNSNFADIYDSAEPAVRNVQTKRDFLASMEAMRAGQGAVLQS